MDREFAILILNASYRASREMGEIGAMAREFIPGPEGEDLMRQAGLAVAEIGRLAETVFSQHPDLEAYVEGQIDRFGRVS